MIFNVLMMMLVLAGGSMEPRDTAHPPLRPKDDCYVNGIWYNPCPGPGPDSPGPPDPREQPVVLRDQ